MRDGDVETRELRRTLRQQAQLNAARQGEVALHALLVQQIAMELRVLQRQRYVIGNCAQTDFRPPW